MLFYSSSHSKHVEYKKTKGKDRADLSERIGAEGRHKCRQAVPEEKEPNAPGSK
jgi:hypothetical protein